MMIKRLKLTRRRKLLGAVVICVVLITGSTMLWQMGQVAEAAILDPHPGLVGWWRFDEGDGTVAQDSSGYGNHGTVYGDATWVDGKHGKALSFDGTDDYISIASFPSLTGPAVSVEAWINLSSQVMQYPDVVEIVGDWGNVGGIKIQVWDYTKLWFRVWNAFAEVEANTPKWTIETGAWHHVVGTYDGQRARLYLDGSLFGTGSLVENAFNLSSSHLYVGRGFTYYINGDIDEVRVHNRALAAAEIQEIFQKGPNFSSELLTKVPKGTTEFTVTLSWQGVGSTNITIESPSKTYTEDMVPVYQRTAYSSSNGDMLNIKRLAVSTTALSSDEDWYVLLEFDDVEDYRITVEVQR